MSSPKIMRSLLALAILAATSCTISSVTGPTFVVTGSPATYQVNITPDPSPGLTGVLAADFPTGWSLTTATYSGTINGAPASGTAAVSPTNPSDCTFSALGAGNQRVFLSAGSFATLPGDSVTVTVTFLVGGAAGVGSVAFTLAAQFGPSPGGICNLANTVTVPVTSGSAIPTLSPLAAVLFAALLALVGALAARSIRA